MGKDLDLHTNGVLQDASPLGPFKVQLKRYSQRRKITKENRQNRYERFYYSDFSKFIIYKLNKQKLNFKNKLAIVR